MHGIKKKTQYVGFLISVSFFFFFFNLSIVSPVSNERATLIQWSTLNE